MHRSKCVVWRTHITWHQWWQMFAADIQVSTSSEKRKSPWFGVSLWELFTDLEIIRSHYGFSGRLSLSQSSRITLTPIFWKVSVTNLLYNIENRVSCYFCKWVESCSICSVHVSSTFPFRHVNPSFSDNSTLCSSR